MQCFGISGTNGKTTICNFLLQLWGKGAANLGTLLLNSTETLTEELINHANNYYYHYTNNFHDIFSGLQESGIEYFVFEAWHDRLYMYENLDYAGATFTNLSPDHLDYYGNDMERYFAQKLRFLTEIVAKDKPKVIYADCPYGKRVLEAINYENCILYGKSNEYDMYYDDDFLYFDNEAFPLSALPFFGEYMVQNLLCTIGIAKISGLTNDQILEKLTDLKLPTGRQQKIRDYEFTAYVDYAHNPHGLLTILKELKKMEHNQLILVMGLDYTRAPEIRPEMAKIAGEYADLTIITRNHHPEHIKAQIRQNCPVLIERDNEEVAKYDALNLACKGDIVLFATI